jgi:hypothetical protein
MAEARAKPIATPRQLVVIGVLGVILVAVLIGQFGGASGTPGDAGAKDGSEPPAPKINQSADRKPRTDSATGSPEATAAKPAAPAWPKLTAEAAAQHDPFALPEPLARQITEGQRAPSDRKPNASPPRREASAEKVAALRSKGTNVIVRGERGAAAMIGNRVVRVGDVVEGYRVVSIDLQGIVLAPADRQESHEEHK